MVKHATKLLASPVQGKENRKRKRIVGVKRNIIRGPKTAWIYYCNEKRAAMSADGGLHAFGAVSKILSPMWKALSPTKKAPYNQLALADKERYETDKAALTKEDLYILQTLKKAKKQKTQNSTGPKKPLSAYMFFVKTERAAIVAANPGKDFKDIGRILGKTWKDLTSVEQQPFVDMNAKDKQRYTTEVQALATGN
jgi:hypothetical protein